MPNRSAKILFDAAEHLDAEGPPSLTQLAAQTVLLEAALVYLADTSPNRGALLRWLRVAGAAAEHDTPTGHAIRSAARRLTEKLEDAGRGGPPWG